MTSSPTSPARRMTSGTWSSVCSVSAAAKPSSDLPWQFADARDPVGPSGRQLFFGHDFDPRFGSRQCDQFAVGALRNDFSVIDQHDPVAQALRFFHVVGAVEDRAAGLRGLLDHRKDSAARLRIDADGRLVEHDRRRRMHHSARDVQPAHHAAGKFLDRVVGTIVEADFLEQTAGAVQRVARGHPLHASKEHEVFERGERRVQRQRLRHQAEASARRSRIGRRDRARQSRRGRSPARSRRTESRAWWSCRRRWGRAGRRSRRR